MSPEEAKNIVAEEVSRLNAEVEQAESYLEQVKREAFLRVLRYLAAGAAPDLGDDELVLREAARRVNALRSQVARMAGLQGRLASLKPELVAWFQKIEEAARQGMVAPRE